MAAASLFAVPETASAQSFWNWGPGDYYYEQRPVRPKRVKIKRKPDPAEAQARNAAKPVGPLVIAVSIEKQRVKVYDTNGLFAEAPVSTGTRSHPTPMGVFSIIQKNRHHVSNLYGASMPYMQRITWSGVAMHTGPLPGYAASHGCIRLPNEFAARLWTWTKMGTRVIVAPGEIAPRDFSHPKLVARMVPQPSISALPASGQITADTASAKPAGWPQRTADAREAIEGMKGTLTDVGSATPVETKTTGAAATKARPAEAKSVTAPGPAVAAGGAETPAEPKQPAIAAGDQAPADANAEAKRIDTAEKPAGRSAQASDELAVKPEDRNNNDDSETTAATTEPAEDRPAEAKPAVAAPAEARPAEPVQEIAKPADIMKPVGPPKPADAAKPADVAAPSATEPAKPVVTAQPRRHNHVAVFISRKDRKLYVRHGYEPVYDTPVEIADAERPLGTHVFTARPVKDDTHALHWSVVSLPQVLRKSDTRRAMQQGTKRPATAAPSSVIPPLNPSDALDRISIPAEALEKIASIIAPGGSLLISDHGLTGWETGKGTDFIVPLR
jgi:hypothetical protein